MLAAAILGVMVIGGMTNELVVAKTALKIGSGKSATQIQSVLDGIIIGTSIFGIICAQFGILAA